MKAPGSTMWPMTSETFRLVSNFAAPAAGAAGFGLQAQSRTASAVMAMIGFKAGFPRDPTSGPPHSSAPDILCNTPAPSVKYGLLGVTGRYKRRSWRAGGGSKVAVEDIRELAQRLRARQALGRSDGLNRLFDYLVETSAAGARPKEFEVAAAVFGRSSAFDGAQDA